MTMFLDRGTAGLLLKLQAGCTALALRCPAVLMSRDPHLLCCHMSDLPPLGVHVITHVCMCVYARASDRACDAAPMFVGDCYQPR